MRRRKLFLVTPLHRRGRPDGNSARRFAETAKRNQLPVLKKVFYWSMKGDLTEKLLRPPKDSTGPERRHPKDVTSTSWFVRDGIAEKTVVMAETFASWAEKASENGGHKRPQKAHDQPCGHKKKKHPFRKVSEELDGCKGCVEKKKKKKGTKVHWSPSTGRGHRVRAADEFVEERRKKGLKRSPFIRRMLCNADLRKSQGTAKS